MPSDRTPPGALLAYQSNNAAGGGAGRVTKNGKQAKPKAAVPEGRIDPVTGVAVKSTTKQYLARNKKGLRTLAQELATGKYAALVKKI